MDEMFATMGNKTTKESTMDEQNELNELKRQMEEQQKKLAAKKIFSRIDCLRQSMNGITSREVQRSLVHRHAVIQ